MTTPDPIALPDCPPLPAWLVDSCQSKVWAAAWETLSRHITALTPAPQVPGDMAVLRTIESVTYRKDGSSTPPLNEPFGSAEQLASLEQRARELLKAQYLRSGMADATAETLTAHVERTQPEALRAITAALSAQPRGDDFPAGAIENGRTFADRLESYPFESLGGDLRHCSDWQEFRRCFEFLADWAVGMNAAPQPREVRAIPSQEQLIEWAVGWRGSDSREGLTGEADMIERITYAIRAGLLATTPQDAAGVVPEQPIGSIDPRHLVLMKGRNGTFSGNIIRVGDAMQPGDTLLYTTPPPGVDVGKLREFVVDLRAAAALGRAVTPSEVEQLAAIIDAAAPGVGNG
ncbi:hypothetical protein [Pseudoxanthomonas sp.]|uniref:hypothetical protein n=1 Tax=Pseudoxanthomonas sp. TaxID=1871049 RepID=UPI003F7E0EAA